MEAIKQLELEQKAEEEALARAATSSVEEKAKRAEALEAERGRTKAANAKREQAEQRAQEPRHSGHPSADGWIEHQPQLVHIGRVRAEFGPNSWLKLDNFGESAWPFGCGAQPLSDSLFRRPLCVCRSCAFCMNIYGGALQRFAFVSALLVLLCSRGSFEAEIRSAWWGSGAPTILRACVRQ